MTVQDIVYTLTNRKPTIHLFGRTDNKEYKEISVHGFKPYFYVPTEELEILDKSTTDNTGIFDSLRYCRSGESSTDVYGRSVTKVYTDIPGRVSEVRDFFSYTDESDILFTHRFIVDKKITYGISAPDTRTVHESEIIPVELTYVEPRILFFDIEILNPPGIMPLPQKVLYPVATIQVKDSYTNKKFVITTGMPTKLRDTHIPASSERELFEMFFVLLKKINPDVLTGWFISGFDIPYLIRRATVIGANTKNFCRIMDASSELMPNKKYRNKIPGRQVFDMLDGFKKLKKSDSELEDYRLKTVSALYGFPYTDYGAHIQRLYDEKAYDTLLDYCENDVDSLTLINDKLQLFRFFESVRSIAGCELEDTIYNSRIIKIYLMHRGIAPMPRKIHTIDDGSSFEGATVLEPKAGIHENVGWVDLKSLYPMIMMAFDLSPDIQKIVPKTLKFIVGERDRLRELNKKHPDTITKYQEMVMKYLANSFYGVLGSKEFPIHDEEIAALVTEYGRKLAALLKELAISYGYIPVYGDTDSIAFKPVLSSNEGLIIQNKYNRDLAIWSEQQGAIIPFTLKFEKLHGRLMFKRDAANKKAAKKRYAGLLTWSPDYGGDCRKLDFTGIEIKRSDQSKITKQLLLDFLNTTFLDGDIDKAVNMVKTTYNAVIEQRIDPYDISIPRNISSEREDPWVRGRAIAQNQYGYIFEEGTKPRLLYLTGRGGTPKEICVDSDFDISQIVHLIDYQKQAEKTIRAKLESYMISLGYTWNEVVNGQKSIFDF